MIPKIIHYCWFGRKPIPTLYEKYIESWKIYLPNYEIKEWNEDNFDVNCTSFCEEAYEKGKFAYVSDYARLRVLYDHGGVYFDTDVEVIRPMEDLIEKGPWMGIEKHTSSPDEEDMVALGLGFAVEPRNPIIKEIMAYYENHHYTYPDGHLEQITIVLITTDILRKHGKPSRVDVPINVAGITIYPWEWFCPQEGLWGNVQITENTYTIHHFSATWMSRIDRIRMWRGHFFQTNKFGIIIRKLFKR